MLDIVTDLTAVSHIFGAHVEHLEVDELSQTRLNVSDEEIRQQVEVFREAIDIQEGLFHRRVGTCCPVDGA
jgi:L-arabinose isomerase